MTQWLSVIGIGDNGANSLSPEAKKTIAEADAVIGAKRHFDLLEFSGEAIQWPSPFDHMIDLLKSRQGQKTVVLATGDPLWFSVGEKLSKVFASKDIKFFSNLSAFQLAAMRLHWPLTECICISLHGRAVEELIPHLHPNQKILALTRDGKTPKEVAKLLVAKGFGKSKITALGHMGSSSESKHFAPADEWGEQSVPDFNTIGIELCADSASEFYGLSAGLPDSAFTHDGRMTKQIVRAATLSKLRPTPASTLWDIGAGCGSIGIEWMRFGSNMRAIAIEPRDDRIELMKKNANNLGVPQLQIVKGLAPDCLSELVDPDAVFIGGGLSDAVIDISMARLKKFGRLVANAVTLESEAVLLNAYSKFGGSLERIEVAQADPVGDLTGWRPKMPVTQWSWSRNDG